MLIDTYGRHVSYLRVSITDRCDMRCGYCMPEGFRGFEEPDDWLRLEESARLVRIFAEFGVNKVRITGGEPLLRKGVVDFARAYASNVGVQDVSLSTNGSLLTRFAEPLKRAGVRRLNVSLDTLDRQRFEQLTKRDALPAVLAGLQAAKDLGFAVIKLNAVVQADTPEEDIEALLAFSVLHGFVLRLIEPMPLGVTGQQTSTSNLTTLGTKVAARHRLTPSAHVSGAGPARYWQSPQGHVQLGVITPMSQHFCETCNRVRLTVDGRLLLCLGQEDAVPLGKYMRQGYSDQDLRNAIRKAIHRKPERHHFQDQPEKIVRFMSATGG